MNVQSFGALLDWILAEFGKHQSIFGIHRSLFYTPEKDSRLQVADLFGHHLATPVGPAAGPHTQLAQNIVCAWLSGARFIELKTIQILDELEIPRPCIDLADEGYNVEWSQELKLEESASEYVKAWALIHVLRRLLSFDDSLPFGTIFNMSVGYDLAGIQSPPVARFMDRLKDASEEIGHIKSVLDRRFPQFADVDLPTQITNNVTLSTMHGCPPNEIERIGTYLLADCGLHTIVKLNPTLLGPERVRQILHDRLRFTEIDVPDAAFKHDPKFDQAVALIGALKDVAADRGLVFGVKLSNTLQVANHRGVLSGDDMYMSGRALYPITMALFNKLSREFAGDLHVSYSGGADACNVAEVVSCGALPVTVASDLLKPGGYSRLSQYLTNLRLAMERHGVSSVAEFACDGMANLERAAARALTDARFKKGRYPDALPKATSTLSAFDCIVAPCVVQCAVRQDVPEYSWLISRGRYDEALAVILARNPLPAVTGHVCTHLCQTRCTRNNYDDPVAIRALKRFAAEKGSTTVRQVPQSGHQVAVVGSGPSGLAAACFLALNGVQVTVFEAKDRAGGMLALAPTFRLPKAAVDDDIDRIRRLGVRIELSHPLDAAPETLLEQGFDAVYVASGAQLGARLGIEGEEGLGVYQALDVLDRAHRGADLGLGNHVLVIGGGNSAMDAARTAKRLTGGDVAVVYRRTQREMPATAEELDDLQLEGIRLLELCSPAGIVLEQNRVVALECVRNELGQMGADGRRAPVPIQDSKFRIPADAVILAIGQRMDVGYLSGSDIRLHRNAAIIVDGETGRTSVECVYAGGDAVRGPATIIEACADGRRAAEAICRELGVGLVQPATQLPTLSDEDRIAVGRLRATRSLQVRSSVLQPECRTGFDLVEDVLTEEQARVEARRCLQCSAMCNKCVEVCPNRANLTYAITPVSIALPRLAFRDGQLEQVGQDEWRIDQTRQIIHVQDFCNECGNCATFCVHEGKPYLDKPRLFLLRSDFERERDNALHVSRSDGAWLLRRRSEGRDSRLLWPDDADMVMLESGQLFAEISLPSFSVLRVEPREAFVGQVSLVGPAEMLVILMGVSSGLTFLPFERVKNA